METRLLSEVIDDMRTGDLIAYRITRYNSLTSLLLKIWQKTTKNKYSHVGVVLKLEDRVFIVEAIPPRVAMVPITLEKSFYWIPTQIDDPNGRMVSTLTEHIGTKYNVLDILWHYLGMERSKDSLYCSVLASEFYNDIGYLRERESGHTPDTIVKAIKERSNIQTEIHVVTDRGNLK